MPPWILLLPQIIKIMMEIFALFAKKPAAAVSVAKADLKSAIGEASLGDHETLAGKLRAIRDRLKEII